MKIAGKTLATRNTKSVQIVRGEERFTLTVCALPPGWEGRIRAIGLFNNQPKAKMVAKERLPGVVIRDSGGNVIFEEDRNDPAYVAAITKFTARIEALRLAENLSMDPSVEFEAKRPENNELADWIAYGDALAQEIEHPETGFTAGEIEQILTVGIKLDSSIDVMAGANSFLPPA